jgi:hypothetical protein
VLMQSQTLSRRPAPPGATPVAPTDAPPDGWEQVEASRRQRLGVRVDSAVLRLADVVASAMSRRGFLAGVGGAGAALVTFGGVRGFWGTGAAVAGHETFSCDVFHGPGDQNPGACAPWPPCPDNHCIAHPDDIIGKSLCHNALGAVTWQHWTQGTCGPAGAHSCWKESCCDGHGGGGIAMCCDCCTTTNMGAGQCSSCESATRYLCMCDGRRHNC